MAWTHVGNGNSPIGSNLQIAVTAGDIIVVFLGSVSGNTTGVTSVSDGGVNTYTKAGSVISNRPSIQEIYRAIATTTTTVTINVSGGNVEILMGANFSNNSGTIPGTVDDVQSDGSGSTASVNLTTTVADDLLVGFGDASNSNTPGTGFTQIATNANTTRVTSEYQTSLTNSPGTNAVSLTQGVDRSIIGVAFKPPTVAGGRLFRDSNLSGLQGGGPFFINPLGKAALGRSHETFPQSGIYKPNFSDIHSGQF